MFGRLWKKECAQVGKSLIYWLYVICLILFFTSQLGSLKDEMITKPQKGQESYGAYGYKTDISEEEIMESAIGKLAWGYYYDYFTTYPVGFAKNVQLNETEKAELAEVLEEVTDLTADKIEENIGSFFESNDIETIGYAVEPKEGLSYSEFLKQMKKVVRILGPGSDFTEERMKQETNIPVDYEGAVKAYQNLVQKDGYVGGYARLFCDYMGIMLGILPIFVTATRMLRDRRAGMQELVFARKAPSAAVIGSRYLAGIFMAMLPVVLLSVLPLSDCILFTKGSGIALDYLAVFKYDFGWLLPTVMAVTAVGVFFTELTDTALAVLIQAVWWMISLFGGVKNIYGGMYGWNLVPRHNTELNYAGFADGFTQLMANRIFYVVLSLVLVAASIFIYEQKRRGHLKSGRNILRHRKTTSQA